MITCPSCESGKCTKFRYWKDKQEWVFLCQDCSDLWIESDRCALCDCKYPLFINVRGQELGFWCQKCDVFPFIRKKSKEEFMFCDSEPTQGDLINFELDKKGDLPDVWIKTPIHQITHAEAAEVFSIFK